MTRASLLRSVPLLTAALVTAGLAAAAPAAGAQTASRAAAPAFSALSGLTTVDLQGTTLVALSKSKVTIGATAPAQKIALGTGARLLLPVGPGVIARNSTILQTGSITLARRAGGKQRLVTFSSLRLSLDATPSLTAVTGGKRVDLLSLDLRRSEYSTSPAAQTARIVTTRASLPTTTAKLVARKLSITSLKPGLLGVLGTTVSPPATGTGPAGTPPTPAAAVGPTGVAGTTPASAPTGAENGITPLARPAGAVDLTANTVNWHVRESFIRYLAQSSAIKASNGATLGAPQVIAPSSASLIYDAQYAPAGGWYDAASGTARLLFTGTVNLSYKEHGIDLSVSDLQIELNGANSRALARFSGSSAGAAAGLGLLATLDPTGAVRSQDGLTSTYGATPAAVPAGTSSSVFAGFYSPGDPFGNFSFTFTRAS